MIKRPLFGVLPLVAVLVTGVAAFSQEVGTQAARRNRQSGIRIERAKINPRKLSGNGGQITVRVKVKAKGSITSVTSAATQAGGSSSTTGPAATLSNAGSGFYTGTVTVPANLKRKRAYSNVFVSVETSQGSKRQKVGRVLLDASVDDPTQPPPPPNI